MRSAVALLVLALAACGPRGNRGPAWPERAERDEDGGESLAPRQASVVAEAAAEPEEEAAPAETSETTAPAEATTAEPTTPTVGEPVVAPEEVINIDDIVIEIEEE